MKITHCDTSSKKKKKNAAHFDTSQSARTMAGQDMKFLSYYIIIPLNLIYVCMDICLQTEAKT